MDRKDEAFEAGMGVRRDMFGPGGAAWTQLKVHVRGALTNGATMEEIREVLLHTAVYAGIPAGVEAFTAAAAVLGAESH